MPGRPVVATHSNGDSRYAERKRTAIAQYRDAAFYKGIYPQPEQDHWDFLRHPNSMDRGHPTLSSAFP